MTETDRLRELLELAAPTDPDLVPTERTGSVVRRGRAARRRDRVLVVGAAMAVVATTVAVPLSLRGADGRGPEVATPAPPAVSCPAAPIDVSDLPSATLAGITSARACATYEAGTALPTEPIMGEDATAFASEVLALPAYTLPDECAAMMVLPDPWAIVAETTSGDVVVIGSPVRACGGVLVNGVERDPAAVVAGFERYATAPATLSCPEGDHLAEGAPLDNEAFDVETATTGVVCYREDPLGSREYASDSGELTDAQLAVVRDGLTARVNRAPTGSCIDTGPQRLILLADDFGHRVAFVDDRCYGEFAGPGGVWKPSEAAERAIREALGGRP